MTDRFIPRLDILPPPQRRLWSELHAVPGGFVLYGGTAIALQLGHRQSADFDFFGNRAFDLMTPLPAIALLAHATIIQQAPNRLSAIVDRDGPVRLSFFDLPGLVQLARPLIAPDNGVKIAALIDLAATKALVVQQRAEERDYLDLDAILREGGIDLPTALSAARAIYRARFNSQITLKALSYFGDGTLPRLPTAVKDRLPKAAREVDLSKLPPVSQRRVRTDRRSET